MTADPSLVAALYERVGYWRTERTGQLFTLGICGAQGCGKSTLTAALAERLRQDGLGVATLSLDDLYLTRAQRQVLARNVHPLLTTRGVPGTHDLALGLATLAALHRGEAAALPRFDKASDDRLPKAEWPLAPAETQVLLLEGWCLGARPQADSAQAEPVNALEADEDPHGTWRRHANAALAGDYQRLFARIDRLVFLAAPGWEVVSRWREQQEAELRSEGGSAVMSSAEVSRFIQHYERLTRHMLATMPDYADLTVGLGLDRAPL